MICTLIIYVPYSALMNRILRELSKQKIRREIREGTSIYRVIESAAVRFGEVCIIKKYLCSIIILLFYPGRGIVKSLGHEWSIFISGKLEQVSTSQSSFYLFDTFHLPVWGRKQVSSPFQHCSSTHLAHPRPCTTHSAVHGGWLWRGCELE